MDPSACAEWAQAADSRSLLGSESLWTLQREALSFLKNGVNGPEFLWKHILKICVFLTLNTYLQTLKIKNLELEALDEFSYT